MFMVGRRPFLASRGHVGAMDEKLHRALQEVHAWGVLDLYEGGGYDADDLLSLGRQSLGCASDHVGTLRVGTFG